MADKKASTPHAGGMTVDPTLVRELADMLTDTGLTEIEVEEGDRRIRVSRAAPVAGSYVAAAAPVPAPVEAAAAAPAEQAPAPAADLANAIKSPMVGTAYLAPEPEAANFFAEGDRVKKGDTLLIVEAMKVMNPITAPADGTLQQLLIGNGEPVEFGQPLAIIS
ncbi:acetyl-CoA carboxylase biotin carboxyl carrier protein [Aurantiacibacter atlanticus]|uniref:Biotin carboxyl carrier protein of acetyl-CoA carboxylase n=1 Tax=Aurantiacibacter atlanticus TaxID=1648404 RepID=A0A0H4VGS0_9SPHN|nr:acetyl-CoA carboxylase biotin carboxyl carrier protein [Aurantiacibacter atlanticus]AKQ42036.1 acetyl-CoA carboxylase biotin carboxyl carrier protein [Aurantiacibacter atlanticus]MDF1834656.1 acetyl-CoA carboxylase biotin carboxyl carrier protein [Alteraurantiacibacter sp. bin_em_oilr2.035]